jgi:hypothetical protein
MMCAILLRPLGLATATAGFRNAGCRAVAEKMLLWRPGNAMLYFPPLLAIPTKLPIARLTAFAVLRISRAVTTAPGKTLASKGSLAIVVVPTSSRTMSAAMVAFSSGPQDASRRGRQVATMPWTTMGC